ncbi:hypothetical protein IGJ09_001789 [Enterococcus sp. DIV1434a]
MKYTIAGILSVIIMFGAIIFVFFGKKPVEESVHTSTETTVKSSTKISESSTVSSTATTESSTEITSVSSDES